ncbi:MAG: hypothetical protein ACR2P6_08785 [Gammaproteobacteria bacterium]
MAPDNLQENKLDTEVLRQFGIAIVRYISDTAIDPHTYFEKQFSGELQAATSEERIIEHVTRLLSWLEALEFSEQQCSQLDQRLLDASLPKIAIVRNDLTARKLP